MFKNKSVNQKIELFISDIFHNFNNTKLLNVSIAPAKSCFVFMGGSYFPFCRWTFSPQPTSYFPDKGTLLIVALLT